MSKLSRLSPQDRFDLVAYLDNELDDDTVQRLQKTLADSPVARTDVEMLSRTYELLDLLPKEGATVAFTQRTMTTVRLSDERGDITKSKWFHQTQAAIRFLLGAAVIGGLSTVSYFVTSRLVPREDALKLKDYPIILKLEEYEHAGDIDFLTRLGGEPQVIEQLKKEVDDAAK